MNLTPKQERFCQCIVSGMDGTTAYSTAYETNATQQTRRNEANRLLMRDDITQRIEELQRPVLNQIQNTAISERQKQIDFIKSRIAHCQETEDENSLIRWSDQLNKILGIYKEDIKTEAPESTVSRLDTDTLLKIAGSVQ